jgi:hypothetical protein
LEVYTAKIGILELIQPLSLDSQYTEAVYGDVAAEGRCLVYALSHHLAVLGTCAAASKEYFERRCTKVFKRLAHLGLFV